MKVLQGKVNFSKANKKEIQNGAVATISVNDCSLMDVAAITLGKIEIKDLKSFPFDYSVEFDESKINYGCSYGFTVSCRIEKDSKLLYLNDTSHQIIENDRLLDRVDIDVISIVKEKKVLKGKIICSKIPNKQIELGAVASVSVCDCSRMDVAAITLGKIEIKDLKSFPFDYSVEFDESKINYGCSYGFTVSCRIEKNGKLLFLNDTRHSIIENNRLLDHVDVDVICIN